MKIEEFEYSKFFNDVIRELLELKDLDGMSVCAVDKKGDIYSWHCDIDSFKLGQIIAGFNKDVTIMMIRENREVFRQLLAEDDDD